ncbi:MAG: fatty acid oxidation complex subunit alpha FadB, partial [Thiothrix sp.]
MNKLNQVTLAELNDLIAHLATRNDLQGILISSAKDVFIVGADVTEFPFMFSAAEAEIAEYIQTINVLFNQLEDLPVPSVVAINGTALGGGFELALAADYRVAATTATVGLPEVKLGIHPGWGGSVRLPRLIGVDNANEWICSGTEKTAQEALACGAVDAVVALAEVRTAALDLLHKAIAGDFDYRARRREKQQPVCLNSTELLMAFASAHAVITAQTGKHYPAPLAVLQTMQQSVTLERDAALALETRSFAKLAKHPVTTALIGIFLKEQYVKKLKKAYEAQATPVQRAAVLGAGIMGGGIAYQSAYRGIPVLLKDIRPTALHTGMQEAIKLLDGQLQRGKISAARMAEVISQITPTLNYGDFQQVDLVVEAVVENLALKQAVLVETEAAVCPDTVITSNTSTISITELAAALQRPENFCGMHFFNPVHKMPLVEVIRGKRSSEQTIARTVAYAKAIGKTAIVVNDCPGFLVNRILFPYLSGFMRLVHDGADFQQIDRVMEAFGWPMGPAYLLDVVGIDTAHHAAQVMAAGFPERMSYAYTTALDRLYAAQRFGQKNGKGFYQYAPDRQGKPLKRTDPDAVALVKSSIPQDFSAQTIVERLMIPLCIEAARCLEDGIVASPAEADMALIYGIGFPPFLGGAFH